MSASLRTVCHDSSLWTSDNCPPPPVSPVTVAKALPCRTLLWLLSVCRYSSQNPNVLVTTLSLVPALLTMAPGLLLPIPCMLMFFWWLFLSSSPSNV